MNDQSWIDIEEEYLTKDKFVKVYEKCGKFLHAASPFIDEATTQQEYQQIWVAIPQWRNWILRLLNRHIIKLYNQKELFYIIMKNKGTGTPAGNIFVEETENDQD